METIHANYENNEELKKTLIYCSNEENQSLKCLPGFENISAKFREITFAGIKNISDSFMTISVGIFKIKIKIAENVQTKRELLEYLNSKFVINGQPFLVFNIIDEKKIINEYIGPYIIKKMTEQDIKISCSDELCLQLGLLNYVQLQRSVIDNQVNNIIVNGNEEKIVNTIATLNHVR